MINVCNTETLHQFLDFFIPPLRSDQLAYTLFDEYSVSKQNSKRNVGLLIDFSSLSSVLRINVVNKCR